MAGGDERDGAGEIIAGYAEIGMQPDTVPGFVNGDTTREVQVPFTFADAVFHELGPHLFNSLNGGALVGPGVIDVSGAIVPAADGGAEEANAVNRTNERRVRTGSPYQRSRYEPRGSNR